MRRSAKIAVSTRETVFTFCAAPSAVATWLVVVAKGVVVLVVVATASGTAASGATYGATRGAAATTRSAGAARVDVERTARGGVVVAVVGEVVPVDDAWVVSAVVVAVGTVLVAVDVAVVLLETAPPLDTLPP
jgi:hypothetical protein